MSGLISRLHRCLHTSERNNADSNFFIVGVRPFEFNNKFINTLAKFGSSFITYLNDHSVANHAVLFIQGSILEFSDEGVECFSATDDIVQKYDWLSLGEYMHGETAFTGLDVLSYYNNSSDWRKGDYKLMTHNCHSFVLNACRFIGWNKPLLHEENILVLGGVVRRTMEFRVNDISDDFKIIEDNIPPSPSTPLTVPFNIHISMDYSLKKKRKREDKDEISIGEKKPRINEDDDDDSNDRISFPSSTPDIASSSTSSSSSSSFSSPVSSSLTFSLLSDQDDPTTGVKKSTIAKIAGIGAVVFATVAAVVSSVNSGEKKK